MTSLDDDVRGYQNNELCSHIMQSSCDFWVRLDFLSQGKISDILIGCARTYVLQVIYSFHFHTNFTAKYAIKIPYIPMSESSYIRCFTEPSNVSLRQYIKQKKVKMSSNNISSEK